MDQNSFHSVHITRASEFLVAESGFLHSLYFLDLGIILYKLATGSYERTVAPLLSKSVIKLILGAYLVSLVSGLKDKPHTEIVSF